MSSDGAIYIQGLQKSFKELQVLKDLNLIVERGKVLALLGPNGAGKTTTVRILSTLLAPDQGTVLVNGHNVVTEPNKVRQSIGLTGQYTAVDEYLTGLENLEMMGRLYHLSIADSKQRAKELLVQFNLEEAANRAVKTYSGGMRRKLDLATSLIATPPIIFLDEPTTGLDPRSRLAMWDVIKQLVAADATILLTTQYLEEADQLADKIAVIDDGRVIAEGTAAELKSRVGSDLLELVIAKESNFEAVAQMIDAQGLQSNDAKRTISVPISGGVGEIKHILEICEQAGINIETLSLHKPTLDDVFLQFTGHEATKEEGEK
jgi:ABC-2 type transport system ATP-binding protein